MMKDNSLELDTKYIGHPYIHVEETGSTNDDLKRMAAEGAVHGTVLCADYQTGGKGRRGRTWDSPKGENIYLSILLRPELEPVYASMLTLVAALAAAEAVEEASGAACKIKWPNDLVLERKKVCGILTEMTGNDADNYSVIVGIGINVDRDIFPEEIAHMAASIDKGQGKNAIIAALLKHFERKYEVFVAKKSLKPFLDEYHNRLVSMNTAVQIIDGENVHIRCCKGIDSTGAMIVQKEDGQEERIISGEVSVRGLYGYV